MLDAEILDILVLHNISPVSQEAYFSIPFEILKSVKALSGLLLVVRLINFESL